MPLPLIPVVIGGAAALIGGKGVHSGAKGIQKIRRAKKSLAKAQRRYDTTFNQVEHDRRNVNRAAEQYGALKLHLGLRKCRCNLGQLALCHVYAGYLRTVE